MKYEIISENRVQVEHEYATQYLFIDVPWVDGQPLTEDEIVEFFHEEFEVRIYSDYDCTGRWFTSGMTIKIFDEDDFDEKTVVTCSINWARDL